MGRSLARLGAVLLGAMAGGALAGCYHHVVGVEGYGGTHVDIYEPNLKEGNQGPLEQIDSAVWGENQTQSKAKVVRGSPRTKQGG